MDDIAFQQEVDYKQKVSSHGSYRFSKLTPLSGSQTVTLSLTGTSECQFEIPSKVFNPARSILSFEINIAAQGAGNYAHVAGASLSMLDRVSLFTRGGIHLVDLTSVANVSKMFLPVTNSLEEFFTYPTPGDLQTTATAGAATNMLCKSNVLAANNYGQAGIASMAYVEPDYTFSSAAANAVAVLNVQIPLRMLTHTLLAMDKNLYMGETLVLRVQLSPANKFAHLGTDADDPATGAGALTGAITATNMALYLAVESNASVAKQLIDRVHSSGGVQMIIPYTYTYKFSSGAGTSSSVQYRFNRGHGKNLLRVYHSLFNNTEANATSLLNQNDGTVGMSSFYTTLDHQRLQDFSVTVGSNGLHYMLMHPLIKGSCVQDISQFNDNWLHIDDWSGRRSIEFRESDGIESGISLEDEHIWSIDCVTANAAFNQYTLAVTQRILNMQAGQISVL